MVCIICDHRPAQRGSGFCHNCQQKIKAGGIAANHEQPVKFATYQGHVVGFFRNGGGKLIPRLLQRNPDNLPKSKTIDLNTYVEGFSREQVKKLKAAIKELTEVSFYGEKANGK